MPEPQLDRTRVTSKSLLAAVCFFSVSQVPSLSGIFCQYAFGFSKASEAKDRLRRTCLGLEGTMSRLGGWARSCLLDPGWVAASKDQPSLAAGCPRPCEEVKISNMKQGFCHCRKKSARRTTKVVVKPEAGYINLVQEQVDNACLHSRHVLADPCLSSTEATRIQVGFNSDTLSMPARDSTKVPAPLRQPQSYPYPSTPLSTPKPYPATLDPPAH